MDNGSTIGMDRFGISAYLDDERRTDTVVRLVERGYAGRMILSQDAAFYSINSEPSYRRRLEPAWSHHLISDRILPELRARGVEEAADRADDGGQPGPAAGPELSGPWTAPASGTIRSSHPGWGSARPPSPPRRSSGSGAWPCLT